MIEFIHQLEQIDMQIFLFFNGFHSDFWDYFMLIFSDRFVWVPFYASFLFVMVRNFPVKVVLYHSDSSNTHHYSCDQTASGLLKPMIGRMRPAIPIIRYPLWYMSFRGIVVAAYGFPVIPMQPMHGEWLFLRYIWFEGVN